MQNFLCFLSHPQAGSKIAFTAAMLPMSGCLGPFTSNMSISYQSVSLNQGNGYNSALGKQAKIHRAKIFWIFFLRSKKTILSGPPLFIIDLILPSNLFLFFKTCGSFCGMVNSRSSTGHESSHCKSGFPTVVQKRGSLSYLQDGIKLCISCILPPTGSYTNDGNKRSYKS